MPRDDPDKSEMNRKFARLQLNFVASSPITDDIPPRRSKTRLSFLAFMPESFYSRARSSSRMTILGATPVFYGFKKNPEIEIGRLVVDGIAESGASRGYASWIMQDARRARNVERDRNERKGRRMEKKKGAATGGSQRVSVKERFKASLILVVNDEIGSDRRKLRTY